MYTLVLLVHCHSIRETRNQLESPPFPRRFTNIAPEISLCASLAAGDAVHTNVTLDTIANNLWRISGRAGDINIGQLNARADGVR